MPIRITGMNSGLDTESIISELVKAKSEKKNKLVKAQKTLEYKQETWKNINTKIYSFYSTSLSNMRFSQSYVKKKSTVSDSSVASVISGAGAMNGVQSLKVDQLAKAAYLTGNKMASDSGEKVASTTKLSEMGIGEEGLSFSITDKNGAPKTITLTADNTMADFTKALSSANSNLNVSLDANNQRIFIGAKSTGANGNFEITGNNDAANAFLKKAGLLTEVTENGVTSLKRSNYIQGQDSKITLNGAEFTSSNNTFEINGLTISAQKETNGEEVTLTTADDYEGIYDMIKNFLKSYNELINEISSLYNAESVGSMQPLTDEEKSELSESEVKKWEEKLQAASLRKDSTLGDFSSVMTNMMQSSFTINGKNMSLSSFGINTLGFFNAPANERNALHIDGDTSDASTAGNEDKLKSMIANDPSSVVSFFQQLSNELSTKMYKSMSSIKDIRSVYKVYNDKQMEAEYKNYTSLIAKQDAIITKYEDKYYKQFSAMETALAKLQSKESALSGLFG